MFNVSLLKGYDDFEAGKAEVNPALVIIEPGINQDFEFEHILGHQHVGHSRAL